MVFGCSLLTDDGMRSGGEEVSDVRVFWTLLSSPQNLTDDNKLKAA